VQSQVTEKVDVSRIFIHRPDSRASVARVTSLEAANMVLRNWAQDASGPMPADCEVEVVFEDGLRYHSHYPLREQEKNVSLGRHLRRRLTAMTKGKYPKSDQQSANDSFMHAGNRDPAECAQELLEHYNI
jgi:hypothetical protein